jgi:type IV pilus assembly protein PilY1
MKAGTIAKRWMVGGLITTQVVANASPYVLSQVPQNTAVSEPSPNVIVSVDNSGSMAYSSNSADGSVPPTGSTATRMKALQDALIRNFAADRIPDNRIRLAWQAMNHNVENDCVGFAGATNGGSTCAIQGIADANRMRSLDARHRGAFMAWVNDKLTSSGGTPLHSMMARAGEYMQVSGTDSPFSDEPGVLNATQSSCRKTFHIFMTDGDYNLFGFYEDPANLGIPNVGNADGTVINLPSPAPQYIPRAPFRDSAGARNAAANWSAVTESDGSSSWEPRSEYRPTLADLAFSYWAKDLQPGIANNVAPIEAVKVDEAVGGAVVPKFWNPKNDPAHWQHMNTSTIGFGAAATWGTAPRINTAVNEASPTYSGNYAQLVAGSMDWRDPLSGTLPATGNFFGWFSGGTASGYWHEGFSDVQQSAIRMDLWHAAINGRGTFTPASNAAALDNAFQSILTNILNNTSAPLTSIAAGSSKFQNGTLFYQAGYDTGDWSGNVQASSVSGTQLVPTWSARALLDSKVQGTGHDVNRTVLSAAAGVGIPFRWDNLSQPQKEALQGTAITAATDTTIGRNILGFLRGDRSKEGAATGGLRERQHVLGDIVGSSIWYTGKPNAGFLGNGYSVFATRKANRTPMLYVGANDGMLHGFKAEGGSGGGQELFAYVPQGIYGSATDPLLAQLSRSNYEHRYFVDGSPFVGDVYFGALDSKASDETMASQWKSLLVGTLGAGGKGYFILDVTDPSLISDGSASTTVLVDNTDGSDADIGHQYQQPVVGGASRRSKQFVRMNDGRPALLMGNGYNSRDEKAVLLVQYLDGARELRKVYAPASQTAGTSNGLSAPQTVDRDANGTVDIAYAGDLSGKMWRFDLSAKDASLWRAAAGESIDSNGKPLFDAGSSRPITDAPVVVSHPRNGFMVAFGTGRMFAANDHESTAPQALYGIWDNTSSTAAEGDLVQHAVTDTKTVNGNLYRKLQQGGVPYDGKDGKRGWVIVLPDAMERVVLNGEALNSSVGLFSTLIPGTASNTVDCTSGQPDTGWTMLLDLFSGSSPGTDVFGTSDSDGALFGGYYNDKSSRVTALESGTPGSTTLVDTNGKPKIVDLKKPGRRFGWRSLLPAN